jgi:uncharacterized protein (DUF934 family)
MTKQIIKNKEIVEDNWQHLADEDALPDTGKIILSYQHWRQNRDKLQYFNGDLGITIGGNVTTDMILGDLNRFQLIAVHFPEFKDGRGYTHARLLRERYGFRGELRAIGNVLRDQIFYLHRCGFDAFELEEGRDLQAALTAFTDFRVSYQPAAA